MSPVGFKPKISAGERPYIYIYIYDISSLRVKARSRNHCCSGKAICITCSEYVSVALVIEHAKRMRRTILTSVACQVALFHIISKSTRISKKKKKKPNIKCMFSFPLQLLSKTFVILRRIHRDTITNVYRPSCKVPVILVRL